VENPYEKKWEKSFGGDIDHYRDLMDGFEDARQAIIDVIKEK